MNDADGSDAFPGTEDGFERRLGRMIAAAAANDVDVRGGYLVRVEGKDTEYEVQITELDR